MSKELSADFANSYDVSSRPLAGQNKIRYVVGRVLSLLWIWGVAAVVCGLVVMIFYTYFLGRNKVEVNYTIYEGYRVVGQPGASQLSSEEGYGLTTYGEDGMIVNKTLDQAAFRAVFLGDSFVKARQVSDEDKFTQIVEREWNAAHPDQTIQTVNLGLGGQDMRTYLSFGDNVDKQFEPDLVFIWLHATDFGFLARNPEKLAQVANGSSEPVANSESYNTVLRLASDLGIRSFLGQLQAQTFGFIEKGKTNPPPVEASEGQTEDIDPEAVAIQVKALKDIWGDRVVVIYRGWPFEFFNLGKEAPQTYDDNIVRELERQNVPYINLFAPFKQSFDQRQSPLGFNNSLMGQGHLNHLGHKIVADLVLDYMESLNLDGVRQ